MSKTYAKLGKGTTLSIGGTTIAEVTSISGPSLSADSIDVTTMDTTTRYREFIQGLLDGGEVSFDLMFYPGDAGQAAMYTAFGAGTDSTYIITFPTAVGATWTFDGFPTACGNEIPMDEAITQSWTIKLSTSPTLGTTASTGWSAFLLRDSGDSADATNFTITPAVAASTYYYSATFEDDANVYPKVTAASHTIKLYIDGTYIETLTSGSVGSAIAFTDGLSKMLTIIVYEDNKQPKTYYVMVDRTDVA